MIIKHNWSVFLMGIAFILSACQSRHHSQFQGQTAELEIGDSFSKDVFSISGCKFTKKQISLGRVINSRKSCLPEESLTSFWKVIHDQRVDQWAAIYLPSVKSKRTAVTHWVLKLGLARTMHKTSGGGSFPGDKNYLTPVGPDPSNRFYRVLAAFQKLSGNNQLP